MLNPRDGWNARRTLAGVCLIMSQLVLWASVMIEPDLSGNGAQQIAAVAAHPTRALLAACLNVFVGVLLAPALLVIANLPRGRGATMTFAGAALSLLLSWPAVFSVIFAVIRAMLASGAAHDQMGTIIDRIYTDPAFGTMFVLGFGGGILGSILLVLGLYRARIIPLSALALYAAGFALDLAPVPGKIWEIIGLSLITLTYVWIGLAVIRTPEARWSNRPDSEDVRLHAAAS